MLYGFGSNLNGNLGKMNHIFQKFQTPVPEEIEFFKGMRIRNINNHFIETTKIINTKIQIWETDLVFNFL